jgi:hypothetical protein
MRCRRLRTGVRVGTYVPLTPVTQTYPRNAYRQTPEIHRQTLEIHRQTLEIHRQTLEIHRQILEIHRQIYQPPLSKLRSYLNI